MASCKGSSRARSLRNVLKALAVLVFTVPRGTPVLREISL